MYKLSSVDGVSIYTDLTVREACISVSTTEVLSPPWSTTGLTTVHSDLFIVVLFKSSLFDYESAMSNPSFDEIRI